MEFAQASTSFPIVIVKDPESDRYRTVVMLGLEAGENLYHSDKKWEAIYIPHALSIVPFSLGLDPEKEKTLTACIDVDSPFVGEDKDQALFDESGNDTEFFKSIQDQLGRLYENEVTNENFIKILQENDLLQELELNVAYSNGENKKLVGIFGLNDKKLQELADDKVLEFFKLGLFVPFHAMLSSAGQVNRLAQLRNASDNPLKINSIKYGVIEEKKEEAKA